MRHAGNHNSISKVPINVCVTAVGAQRRERGKQPEHK